MKTTLTLALLAAAAASAFAQFPLPHVPNSAYGVEVGAFAQEKSYYGGNWGAWEVDSRGGAGWKKASTYANGGGASATAWGDLATGALHLGATAPVPSMENCHATDAEASVKVWDTVTVYWGKVQVQNLPFVVRFDGSLAGDAHSNFGYVGATVDMEWAHDQSLYEVDDMVVPQLTDEFTRTTTFKICAEADVIAHSTTNPYGPPSYIPTPGVADYTHTLKFMWDLPEGVTYTSKSGVFKPQPYVPYNPVPEPGTFAALGLGALGVLHRRKGRKA